VAEIVGVATVAEIVAVATAVEIVVMMTVVGMITEEAVAIGTEQRWWAPMGQV